jgi:hypothetical protein
MPNNMGPEITFVIALVVAVAAIYWIILKTSAERIAEQYQAIAKKFELELDQPSAKMLGFMRPEPSVFGSYHGREISISAPGKGLQNTRQVESLLKIELKNSQFSAQLTATGLLGGLKQRDSGGQARWKSGDASFDDAIDTRTNQGETLTALLTAERRAYLADHLKKTKATLYIGSGNLAYAKMGLIADEKTRLTFESAIEFLCEFAESIEHS